MSIQSVGADKPYNFNGIVAENIRALAGRRGVSQSDIARAIGFTPQAVSIRWRGRREWQLSDIEKVAAYFGVTPWELCQPYENGGQPKLAAVRGRNDRESYTARDLNPEPSDYTKAHVKHTSVLDFDDFRRRKLAV